MSPVNLLNPGKDVSVYQIPHVHHSQRAVHWCLLFYVLVLVTGYLTYQVLSPFLAPLAWAAVFAMMFYGVDLRSPIGLARTALALVTTLMTAVLIVARPCSWSPSLAREVPQVVTYVQQVSLSAPDRIERIWQVVRARVPMSLPEDSDRASA